MTPPDSQHLYTSIAVVTDIVNLTHFLDSEHSASSGGSPCPTIKIYTFNKYNNGLYKTYNTHFLLCNAPTPPHLKRYNQRLSVLSGGVERGKCKKGEGKTPFQRSARYMDGFREFSEVI